MSTPSLVKEMEQPDSLLFLQQHGKKHLYVYFHCQKKVIKMQNVPC